MILPCAITVKIRIIEESQLSLHIKNTPYSIINGLFPDEPRINKSSQITEVHLTLQVHINSCIDCLYSSLSLIPGITMMHHFIN